jgi:uncharacterized membrane protein YraQ (UPF0718 family)
MFTKILYLAAFLLLILSFIKDKIKTNMTIVWCFPVAGVLLKKGTKFSNILIFIGAWSTTKIPLLLFEASSLDWKFMLTRFLIDIPGIIIIAYVIEKIMNKDEKALIYDNALSL